MSPTEFSTKRCGESSRCVLHEACFFRHQVSERGRCQLTCRSAKKTMEAKKSCSVATARALGRALLDSLIDRRVGWTIGSVGTLGEFLEFIHGNSTGLWGRKQSHACQRHGNRLEAGAIESKAPRAAAQSSLVAALFKNVFPSAPLPHNHSPSSNSFPL